MQTFYKLNIKCNCNFAKICQEYYGNSLIYISFIFSLTPNFRVQTFAIFATFFQDLAVI